MKVKVKLFGSLSVIIGKREIDIELDREGTVGEVAEKMIKLCNDGKVARRIFPESGKPGVIFILNGERCSVGHRVKDGDEISIMSPISGG